MEKLKLACQSSEEKYVTTNSSSSHYTPETNVDADKLGVSSRALRTDIAAGGILEGATSSENSSEGGLDTNSFDVDGEYDFDKANNVLDNGINLIDSLSEFFSKGISNVYVNEYIMAYCRNYVHHYSMRDDKTVDNSGKVSDKDKYDSVIAKQFCEKDDINKRYISSEVEYILIGVNNEYGNIAGVAGEILLLRTVCNLVAIFSDGNAYQQAGMICSWAGPLQPLVTFALMVAWAVAESAMEVADIMQGEKVALYRKFSEWDLNVQGAISKLVGEATEFVANYVMAEVEEQVKLAWSEFEEQYDAALYDSFVGNATSSGLRADTGNAEANQMINKLNTFVGSVNYSMNDALKTEALEVVTAEYTSLKRNAITKVKQGAMKTAQSWSLGIESNTNTSNVADSGNKKLKLGYKDYIRLLLLLEDETTKLQRLQEVIQMNIRYQQRDKGKPTEELFQMQYAWVNVYAEANCSIKYLFMTEAFLPSAWLNEAGPDGRFHFTVKTNISY